MRKLYSIIIALFAATSLSAQTLTVSYKGSINPTTWKGGEEATVTFSHFPKTVADFKKAQEQLGSRPEGAVVLQLMAFEMWHKDPKMGKECIELCNVSTNYYSVESRIKEVYRKNDSYGREHLVATYLGGSTPENGFNPKKPYTVRVRSSKVHPYERAQSLKGYVLYLEVYSSGYDTHWRGCEVVKQKGSPYYKVSNSPSMYVQCQEVPFDAPDYKNNL